MHYRLTLLIAIFSLLIKLLGCWVGLQGFTLVVLSRQQHMKPAVGASMDVMWSRGPRKEKGKRGEEEARIFFFRYFCVYITFVIAGV